MAKRSYDLLFKLLLIGDSGAGKKEILIRFADDELNTRFIPTMGIDCRVKTIDMRGKKIRLQIWDTVGQERFHTIMPSYYQDAMGIMLVYDITQPKSFDNIEKWLRNIENVHLPRYADKNIEKMLLGNKCDMEAKRAISQEQGKQLADKHGIRFLETCSKTNINIQRAFYELSEAILDKYQT